MRVVAALFLVVAALAGAVYVFPDRVVALTQEVAALSPRASAPSSGSSDSAGSGPHRRDRGSASSGGDTATSGAGRGADAGAAGSSGSGQSGRGSGGGRSGGGGGRRGTSTLTVGTVLATTGQLPITRTAIGWVQPQQTTSLSSRSQEVVSDLAAKDGARVKGGDLLVKFDDRLQRATLAKDQATLAKDEATLGQAQADLQRTQNLVDKGAGTRQSLEDAQVALKGAQATVDADKATIAADEVNVSYTELRAPFSGRLGAFSIAIGALVQPGNSIVTITKLRPIDVRFAMPEDTLHAVYQQMRDGTGTVSVTPSGSSDAPTPGTLSFIDSAIDQASGTFATKATMANDDFRLWPGESVRVEVELGKTADGVLVPSVAVQPAQEGSIAYVVNDQKKIEIRKVEVAYASGETTSVTKGLAAGDHVVVEGQLNLTDGMAVQEKVMPAEGQPAPGNGPAETADASTPSRATQP
ncbi:efflux RND transporter periplasmic adaptor subunit [Aurantimonas sp. MSK8Z-1]|uniref:efflux RND transporter periplasmic adaptor subunit n=1 Tax=Mangrovibrevibacter kandeliae TaxID=2968473 RepID=UPI0021185CE7|nr:efflux RND transporter periplasmic adaptor subunit [Aurantimonas sp. MSK8Z-1]MCW4116075.1 efflux RND transporter periplasmic adaptor subunit [Aurantimonas sp. MSK8Z-1]